MAQPYLDQLQQLVSTQTNIPEEATCKHFFSGAALYINKKICATLSPKGLAFKLPVARCEDIIARCKAHPLQYFENSPVKRGYVLFPEYEQLSSSEISGFFEECVAYTEII